MDGLIGKIRLEETMLEIKPVKPNTAEMADFSPARQIYQPDHLTCGRRTGFDWGSHPLSSDLETYAFIGWTVGLVFEASTAIQ